MRSSKIASCRRPAGNGTQKKDSSSLEIRSSKQANKLNANPRARWTVTHEVSHFANGDEGVRNRSSKGSLEKTISPRIRKIESRTDRFTAALLAPLRLIEHDEPIASIALRFGLSDEAAEIRSEEAARAYRRRHGIQRELPKSIQDLLSDFMKK